MTLLGIVSWHRAVAHDQANIVTIYKQPAKNMKLDFCLILNGALSPTSGQLEPTRPHLDERNIVDVDLLPFPNGSLGLHGNPPGIKWSGRNMAAPILGVK